MKEPVIARHRGTFRAVAVAMVPDLERADEAAWRHVEDTVEGVLRTKPLRMQRQLRLLLGVLATFGRARFGRPVAAVPPRQLEQLLLALQHSRIPLVRRGLWGLRTLVMMGHYTRAETAAVIGYRADARGWSARTPPAP